MGTGVDNGAPPPSPPPPRPAALPWVPPAPTREPWSANPEPAPGHRDRRASRTAFTTGLCLVLGIGLLGGAAVGHWVGGGTASAQTSGDSPARDYAAARGLWHGLPVDDLFPRTVKGAGAGPGDADRTWIRVGVAPDSGCDGAFDPALAKALAPAGCLRLLRATYTDATSTDVTTVGLLITTGDPAAMTALGRRLHQGHLAASPAAMPRPVAFPGTPAAGFGPAQRGSWTVIVSGTLPLVSYAVSGFADGRPITTPQPASAATVRGAATVPAQAGLGFDARGLATAIADRFVTDVRTALHPSPHPGDSS